MLTATLMLFAAQVLAAPGSVTAWETLPDEPSGRYSFDPASIRRDGDIVRVVTRAEFTRTLANGVKTLMARLRIDCRQRTLGAEAADGYREDGRFFGSRDTPTAMRPVGAAIPAHVRLAERVCGR